MTSQVDYLNQSNERSDLIDQLNRKGVFYDVQLVDNFWIQTITDTFGNTAEVRRSTGKRTVVNMDLSQSIGVVSDSYVPVLNKDIFEQFDEVLRSCEGLNLEGAYVKVQSNANGARIMVEYVLPAHTISLDNGDEVALTITALNSFDGSTGFKVFCGGIRFACMNGMVVGDKIASYQKKHCAGLSIKSAGKVIENGLQTYLGAVNTWNKQIRKEIDPTVAWNCLAEFAGIKDFENYVSKRDYDNNRENRNGDGSPRKLIIDNYYDVLKNYISELGQTEWALNNTLTHIATHGVRDKQPTIKSQIDRTELARKLINKYLSGEDNG